MAIEQIIPRAQTLMSLVPQISRGYAGINNAFSNRKIAQSEVQFIESQKANSAKHYGSLAYVDEIHQYLIGRNIHFKYQSSAFASDNQAQRHMLNNLLLSRRA